MLHSSLYRVSQIIIYLCVEIVICLSYSGMHFHHTAYTVPLFGHRAYGILSLKTKRGLWEAPTKTPINYKRDPE